MNYNDAGGTVHDQVDKANPTITWANPANIIYGTALTGTQLSATVVLAGTLVYNPTAGTVLNPVSGQTLSVTFTPTDTTNYNNASKTVTINVLYSTGACLGDVGHTILQPIDADGT